MKRTKSSIESPLENIAPLGEVLSFMRLLWAVSHGLESTSKRMLAELGITGPQRLVLRVVGQNPDISPGDLARVLLLHPSSLTGVLQRLVEAKLVLRLQDPKDGRRSTLTLTAVGRQINARRAGTVEAAIQSAMESLSPDRLRAGEELLRALAAQLDAES